MLPKLNIRGKFARQQPSSWCVQPPFFIVFDAWKLKATSGIWLDSSTSIIISNSAFSHEEKSKSRGPSFLGFALFWGCKSHINVNLVSFILSSDGAWARGHQSCCKIMIFAQKFKIKFYDIDLLYLYLS